MAGKAKHKAEYGDFQTPLALAQAVCARVGDSATATCRVAGADMRSRQLPFRRSGPVQGRCRSGWSGHQRGASSASGKTRCVRGRTPTRIKLVQADFFTTDWERVIGELPEPILVLGNPPWVTNSHLGVLRSENLPAKSNFQKHARPRRHYRQSQLRYFGMDADSVAGGDERPAGNTGNAVQVIHGAQDPVLRLEEWDGVGMVGHLWHRRRSAF